MNTLPSRPNEHPFLIREEFIAYFPSLGKALGSIEDAVLVQWLWFRRDRVQNCTQATIATVADAVGMNERTAKRRLAKLEERGIVSKTRTSAFDPTSVWTIHMDQIPSDIEDSSPVSATLAPTGNTGVQEGTHVSATLAPTVSATLAPTVSAKLALTSSKNDEEPSKNKNTVDGSAADTRDGQVDALLDVPAGTVATAKLSVEDEFEQWYAEYPRKVARGSALKAFKAARKKVSFEVLMNGVAGFQNRVRGSEARFIAHPATWLNAERWADEADEETQARVGAPANGGFFASSAADIADTASMFDDPDPWMEAPQTMASAPDPYAF